MPNEPDQGAGSPPCDPREGGFGLYVHWPFCAAKCPYCDFNSHVRRSVDASAYGDALLREMEHMAGLAPYGPLDTVFFGGGTPSLMPPEVVGRVLDRADRLWGIGQGAEVTLEANPTSSDAARFQGFRAAGVNRLSIGVQALNDRDLKALGRLHSVEEAIGAIAMAREAMPRLSFDLIYARPDQTPEAWTAELTRAIDLAADHLSLYQLTIEPGTAFFDLHERGHLQVPDSDLAADLYEITQEVTAQAGLHAYEVSNHAVPGGESRHNLIYWRYGSYAGIGPGAHGRLVVDGKRMASATLRSPEAWREAVTAAGHGLETMEPVDRGDQGAEYLLMGLRLQEGVSVSRLERLAGRRLNSEAIEPLVADGLVHLGGDRLRATEKGRPVLDGLLRVLSAALFQSPASEQYDGRGIEPGGPAQLPGR